MKSKTYPYLRAVVHIGAWIPLVWLLWDLWNHNLTANPIQAATQRTGRAAINLLVLTLTCTPVDILFNDKAVIRLRKPLGLYAFLYASLHLLLYVVVDYGLSWPLISASVVEKPFILVGLVSFLILLALAVTSLRWWMVRMGKFWKRLHRMVYLVGLLVVLHYAWALKGNIFTLSGNELKPLLYGLFVIFLLVLRLGPVRRRVRGLFAMQIKRIHCTTPSIERGRP